MPEQKQIRTIHAENLDTETQELIRDAGQGKIRLIIDEADKPVAAVMPVAYAEKWEAEREMFFSIFEQAAEHADLSGEEADELALEAVRAVRSRAT